MYPRTCGGDSEKLRAMMMTVEALPPSPTNRVADLPAAVQLGRSLFFDTRMSMDGTIACASCHDPNEGWSDPRPLSLGVEDREGGRHSMPVQATAFQTFWFWDGRADSLWSQAIKAIESHPEMDLPGLRLLVLSQSITENLMRQSSGRCHRLRAYRSAHVQGWRAGMRCRAFSKKAWSVSLQIPVKSSRLMSDSCSARILGLISGRAAQSKCQIANWPVLSLSCKRGASIATRGRLSLDGLFHNIGIGSGNNTPDRGRAEGWNSYGTMFSRALVLIRMM